MSNHQKSYIVFGVFTLVYFLGVTFFEWEFSYYLIFLGAWFLLIAYGSLFIRSNYHLSAINRIYTKEKVVAITFDDGPSEYTSDVLDLLEKHGCKATFFCVGARIDAYEEVFMRIVENGHSIGNHTFTHSNQSGFFSTKRIKREIEATDEVIENLTGKKATLFRPPFGVTNPKIGRALKMTGHKVIGWNIRSLDTFLNDDEKIFRRIKRQIKPGSIILLHDTSEKSVKVLERLLSHLKLNDFRCATIDDLIKNSK